MAMGLNSAGGRVETSSRKKGPYETLCEPRIVAAHWWVSSRGSSPVQWAVALEA